MKKYFKYILTSALIISFSACQEDFLEFAPLDEATVDGWYRNADEIRSATATIYGRPWFGYNDVFAWSAGDVLAGDMHHTWDQEGQFFYVSFNAENGIISGGFQGLYDVISFSNAVINGMPPVAASYGVDQATIDAGVAEARFHRGFAYYILAEHWGAVPIIENPAQNIADDNLNLPRIQVSDVYEFARRDFEYAAQNLPLADEPGRVTSWSAKGALAKLHLTIAQRKVGDASFGSTTADDFAAAAAYAEDVINNSGLALYDSYEDLFKIENENAGEVLFAMQWINQGYATGSSRQARFGRHSSQTGDNAAWGGGKCVTMSFMQDLEANAEGATDERQRAIYMSLGDFYDYIATENGGYEYFIVHQLDDGTDVGPSPLLNNIKKHIVGNDADNGGYLITNQDSPLNNNLLRLSDVYLIYTEALMGSAGSLNSGPGLASYNAVRQRAGLNTRASVSFSELMRERRIEFGIEGANWMDVKRWYYRNPTNALNYLNGQNRTDRYFRIDYDDPNNVNDPDNYELLAAGEIGTGGNENTDPAVVFTGPFVDGGVGFPGGMNLPLPATEVLTNDRLAEDPVPYDFGE